MDLITSLILSFVVVTALNMMIGKANTHLKKNISVIHYVLGYVFILYLHLALKITIRISHPVFHPDINILPFKDGFGIENLLNIVLFMPLGCLLPTLWEKYRTFQSTLYYGLLFSLFIETGQLFVGNRATDINDLIMNTIGTIVGWVIFNALRKVFRKFFTQTAIPLASNDPWTIKLESWVYIGMAIICLF